MRLPPLPVPAPPLTPAQMAARAVGDRPAEVGLTLAAREPHWYEHRCLCGTIVDILTRAGLRPPPQRLRFRATHLPAVRDGSKRVTMRFRDPVEVGPAILVFGSGDEVHLPGRITSAVARPVNRVTDDEARADGFASAAGVLPGLRDYYPGLQPDDEIAIVHFETD